MGFMDELKKLTKPYDDEEDDFFEGADASYKSTPAASPAQLAFEHAFGEEPSSAPEPVRKAQKPASEGGVIRNATLHGVCLLRADDAVFLLLAVLKAFDNDLAAESYTVGIVRVFDNFGVLKDLFKLGNLGVELALLGFRLVIFAVLGQVAEGTGYLYLLRYLSAARGFKVLQPLLVFLNAFFGKTNFCHYFSLLNIGKIIICAPFPFVKESGLFSGKNGQVSHFVHLRRALPCAII